ncbi:MAG TPA: terminase [Terriglobales bacterium]
MIEDLVLLRRLGLVLDSKAAGEETVRDLLVRGLLKIRNKDRKLVLFRRNRAQVEYSRNCTKRNIVLKARQLGMTTYVAARFFIQTITQPGTLTVQVAHTQESAEAIFAIVRRFWENLPEGMQTGALVLSRANVRQLVFPRLDSEYRVATAADPNAGRGMTIHNLHCSEVARWPRGAEETLVSLRAAVPKDGEIVLESTPNGAGGMFYDEWNRAQEMGYAKHFFPWWYEERYRVEGPEPQRGMEKSESCGEFESCTGGDARVSIENQNLADRSIRATFSEEERSLMERFGLDAGQIGWRRENRATLRGMAAQEFAEDPVSCFRASGECVFELEAIDKALAAGGEPVEAKNNGRLLIWFPAQAGRQYLVGVDPAGGGSEGDYSCAQVIDRASGMQCAELHGHYPPRQLAVELIAIAAVYNNALLVVERNNHGHGVLAHLRAMGCGNVYREGEQDGWLTSAVSRPAMIENLAAMLATAPGLFQSPRLLNECRTFVRHVDGSSAAMAGAHDDCVMAMAVGLAARQAVVGRFSRGAFGLASFAPQNSVVAGDRIPQDGKFVRHIEIPKLGIGFDIG